jgi:glycosyltransferase involved in cell wall biosynthesis
MMATMDDSTGSTRGELGPSNEPPEVSVVIPTRNRWDTLARRALRAALIQRDIRLEVIVVDDGSEVPPPDIAALNDPRVSLIRSERHAGASAARNAGIAHARADWIAFLDDDDMWAPHRLASVLTAMQNADADFGYSSVLVLDRKLRPAWVARGSAPDVLSETLRRGNAIPAAASNLVAKASLLARVGGFDETFSAMTWDLCLRLARAGRAESVEDVLVGYPEGSWLLADESANRKDAERMTAKHKDMAVDWHGYERWVASTAYRAGQRREAARRYLRAGVRYRNVRCLLLAGAALLGRGAVDRPRVPNTEAPEWLSLYLGRD